MDFYTIFVKYPCPFLFVYFSPSYTFHLSRCMCKPQKRTKKKKFSHQAVHLSLTLRDASGLKVLQFRNVFVKVQWIGIGEGSPLRHLPPGNHLLHCHLHLLPADGVLQEDKLNKRQEWDKATGQLWYLMWAVLSLTGMSLVSSSRAGMCRADRAFLMAPLILATSSGLKGLEGAIFKNSMTLSSPSSLYWGTHRLSDTSSKASTVGGKTESI